MSSTRLGLIVCAILFALVCLAHLLRVVTGVEVVVASYAIPVWISGAALVVTGAMAVWIGWLARHIH